MPAVSRSSWTIDRPDHRATSESRERRQQRGLPKRGQFMLPQSHPVHFRRRKVAGLARALRAAMHPQTWMGGAVLALLAASDAFAAEGAPSGPSEAIFFAQVGLLLVVGRMLGEAMQRIGQPAVMGQLVAHGARSLRAGRALARPAARDLPKECRAEEHDRCGVAARHSHASAADRY